jgi:hypothetical protein
MKRLLLVASVLILVLAACGGSSRVPSGVSQIDIHYLATSRHVTNSPIHARPVSRRVTDSSQVKSVIDWFDSLKPPGKTSYGCAGGPASEVTFTFRSANGAELAKAYSAALAAASCDPIHLTVHGQQETFLVDSNQKMALINRVGRLLGIKFRQHGYLG